ncbi:MAG: 30S ribosomal protein S7 [Bacteroidetes bacterium SW_11_45_7]|jgi:small subunit ribosomal protein S7|nr:MAG: 30S ribosomal protein S7 [Bacteroidetes bacterium SW_11_45_7]
MRKSKILKQHQQPDPRYNDMMVTQFVNNLMYDGKKSLAFRIFYEAMDIIDNNENAEQGGYEQWKKAIDNTTPSVEVRSRRVGGATFQIPTEIKGNRRVSLSMKWLIRYARARAGKSMSERLANEIMAAANGEGSAVKKKEDTHRMAEANKAFSHFKV